MGLIIPKIWPNFLLKKVYFCLIIFKKKLVVVKKTEQNFNILYSRNLRFGSN